jgi:hypothetical protein
MLKTEIVHGLEMGREYVPLSKLCLTFCLAPAGGEVQQATS